MPHIPDTVRDFLAARRIAVAGVSRDRNQPANAIYRRLRETGHEVVALNPSAAEVEGDRCWPELGSVPGEVDALMVATPPSAAHAVVRAAAERGVPLIWMHRSFGEGSVSTEAVALCRERGIRVIVGGCPMMYCGRVDPVHRCMRWILDLGGRIEA